MDFTNIVITHFINPHEFWFKLPGYNRDFIEFDLSFQNYLKGYDPSGGHMTNGVLDLDGLELNQIVAYFDQKWQRWFRGSIRDNTSSNVYRLFLLDFGFPIVTNVKFIRKIPAEFQSWTNVNLKYAAINQILPATAELDVAAFDIHMSVADEWSTNAISIVQKMIAECSSLRFTHEFELNGQLFGKLYAQAKVEQEISGILIKLQHAVFSENITDRFHNRSPSPMSNQYSPFTFSLSGVETHRYDSKASLKSQASIIETPVTEPEINKINNLRLDEVKYFQEYDTWKSVDEFSDNISISNLFEHSKSPPNGSAYTKHSSSSERRTILNDAESDIDSCISSSPHLTRIINKARTIRKGQRANHEQQTDRPTTDNSTIFTILEPADKMSDLKRLENDQDKQSGQSSSYHSNDFEASINLINLDSSGNGKLDSFKITDGKVSPTNLSPPNDLLSNSEPVKNTSEIKNSSSSESCGGDWGVAPKMNVRSDTSSIETATMETNTNSTGNESSTSNVESGAVVKQQPIKFSHNKVSVKNHKASIKEPNNFEKTFSTYDATKQYQNKKCTFYEKEQRHIVLVHGHTPIIPVESMDQVNFSTEIHYALDKIGIQRLFRIDSYTWPHCLNGTSFVVIGAEKTGKTTSYLPALMNLIMMEEEDGGILDSVGPIALIVVPDSEKVVDTFKLCQKLNRFLDNKLNICKGQGVPNEQLSMDLLNGIHILISTPGCLDRLFNSSVTLINPERVKFFVIDDYHLMIDQINLIKRIIRSSCILNPETNLYEQQIIVTSVYWHNTFVSMLNKTNNSFICIGSYMESAYYAKQDVKLLFMRKDDKLNKLNDLLSNKDHRLNHTLIVCRDSTEVDAIVKHLTDWNFEVISCTRRQSSNLIVQMLNDWNDRKDCRLQIACCTDDMLPELHLNRVKFLIHFSLSISWSKFQYRYSTFFNSLPNLLKNESLATTSIVLIDETNNSELPRFIDFLKIHGVKHINPAIEQISNAVRNQKEEQKEPQQIDFCEYVLGFGVCKQRNICPYRHVLCEWDKSILNLTVKTYIKLIVAHVYTPTHFCVNVLATRNTLNEKWHEFEKENYKVFNLKFKLHYSSKTNHMQHPSCTKGDLCTLNIVDSYYRCKIIHVGEKRGVLSDRRVMVMAIDVGGIHNTTESSLLLLPDQFKTIPPKLMEMRFVGLIPIDNEIKWDCEATAYVQKYFSTYRKNQELFIEARTSFIIRDTIFVDNIAFRQDLGKFGGGELEIRNFRKDVEKKKIGISDPEIIKCVKEFVRAADISVFDLNIQSKTEETEHIARSASTSSETPPKDNSLIVPITLTSLTATNEIVSNLTEDKISEPHISHEVDITDVGDLTNLVSTSIATENSTTIDTIGYKPHVSNSVSLPNKIESINLSCFNSPSNFCVQKMSSLSTINSRLYDIQEYLNESKHRKLENLTIGDICLVFYDGYYDRGEIISICDLDEAYVKICDLGFSIKYHRNDLYELEDRIKNQPFEAITCELFGIKPCGGDAATWDENCIDDIYNFINDNYTDHYVKKVIEMESNGGPKYNVLLCGVNGGMDIINKMLVDRGLAVYNEEVRAVFDQTCETLVAEFDENIGSVLVEYDGPAAFDEEAFCNSLTYEECMAMFNFPETLSSARKDTPPPRATITEITDDLSVENETYETEEPAQNDTDDKIIVYDTDPPPLVSCYNLLPLETIWQQDAETITLRVNVTDHTGYRIELHKRLLNVCVQFDDQTHREITINLFGIVNVENIESVIVGNYLKIVLMKSIRMNLLWPRLVLGNRKCSWLRYNYDSIKDFKLEDDYIKYNIKRSDSSSNSESDEQLDEDDECDPLSTQYNFVENKYFEEND